jgi:hypothetical protein
MAVAYFGRLYVEGILDRRPWDAGKLTYRDEGQIVFNPDVGDRKIHNPDELDLALTASCLGPPSLRLWIAEGLEETARKIWQESRR